MAPRKKKTRSRRRRTFSLLNALESYTYAAIITENVAGTSPWGMLTGEADLSSVYTSEQAVDWATNPFYSGMGGAAASAQEISLGDIVQNPGAAFAVMSTNFQSRLIPMAIQAATVGIGFRIGKRLLRMPLANINRNLVKPVLGAGIRI